MTGVDIALIAIAAASAAYGVHTGERSNQLQRRSLERQSTAQQQAQAAAKRAQKQAAQAQAAANRKQPDLAEIIAGEDELSRLGSDRTRLTGPGGVRTPQSPTGVLGE